MLPLQKFHVCVRESSFHLSIGAYVVLMFVSCEMLASETVLKRRKQRKKKIGIEMQKSRQIHVAF